jgi:translation initiation factor 3 subunit M
MDSNHYTCELHCGCLVLLQVQPWVVRAIGSKLLDGRIDQVAATVTISRCHHRTFTSKEWQGLGQQLSSLRGALVSAADLLGAKQAARGAGGRPAATQAVH